MGVNLSKNEPQVKNAKGNNQPPEKASGGNRGVQTSKDDDDERRGRVMEEYHDYFEGFDGDVFASCPVAFYDTIPPDGEAPHLISGCESEQQA